jgi:hypothetical protein
MAWLLDIARNVLFGSKGEELALSICCPLIPR